MTVNARGVRTGCLLAAGAMVVSAHQSAVDRLGELLHPGSRSARAYADDSRTLRAPGGETRAPAAVLAAVETLLERKLPMRQMARLPDWAQLPAGHGARLYRHAAESVERPEHLPSRERADYAAWAPIAAGGGSAHRLLTGWANYFTLGQVSPAYAAIDRHATRRLRQWLCRKHKVQLGKYVRFPDERLWQEYGLTRLVPRTASFPWAKA